MSREITGPLPAEFADRLDWSRLHGFVEAALMNQPPQIRNPLLEIARNEELDLHPFDGDGFLTVSIRGTRVLRLHWTRLMPGAAEVD